MYKRILEICLVALICIAAVHYCSSRHQSDFSQSEVIDSLRAVEARHEAVIDSLCREVRKCDTIVRELTTERVVVQKELIIEKVRIDTLPPSGLMEYLREAIKEYDEKNYPADNSSLF